MIECIIVTFFVMIFIMIFIMYFLMSGKIFEYTKIINNIRYNINIYIFGKFYSVWNGYCWVSHREDGPARIIWFRYWPKKYYYLNGLEYINKEKWLKELNNRLIKDIIE